MLDALVVALSVALIARLIVVFALRLPYQYDLEWMEGGMLVHAWRVQQGLPLYPPPSPDWVPYVYPPGYAVLVAALGKVFGLAPMLGRAVSLVGTVLAAVAAAGVVRQERGSWPLAVGTAAAFAGTYEASGAFYDLVRPDGLFMGLLALSIWLAATPSRAAAAGFALAGAFALKHNAAFFGPVMLAAIVLRDGWRKGAVFSLASAGTSLCWLVPLQVTSGGLFLQYLVTVPASHPVDGPRILPGTPAELAAALPFALMLVSAALLRRQQLSVAALSIVAGAGAVAASWTLVDAETFRWAAILGTSALVAVGVSVATATTSATRADLAWRPTLWIGLGATSVVVAAWMRGHHGGFLNVLVPMFWMVTVGAGLVAARLPAGWRWVGSMVFVAQLGLQHGRAAYDRLVPTEADEAAGRRIVNRLRGCPGPVWSPYASWLPVLADKRPGPHLIAVWDIAHKEGPFFEAMGQFKEAALSHRWACVLDGGVKGVGYGVNEAYTQEHLDTAPGAMAPKTGWRIQAKSIWVPKDRTANPVKRAP